MAPPAHRRVRANAATATAARADAAIAARDVDAFLATWVEGCEVIDHPTGVVYGLRELGTTWRRALRSAPDLTQRREEIATLGDTLGLFRNWISASASAGGTFDVGPYEIGQVFLNEVDGHGQHQRSERFAVDRLGDAVLRLYERYAELLATGPARTRAAVTARAVAALLGPFDLDRYAAALAPAMETVDHRTLGTWSARGAEAMLQHYRSILEIAADIEHRFDDILGLRADALLARRTHLGIDRTGGGAYERQILGLWVFGTDGRVTRLELFDSERDAEALARFDELVASSAEGPTRASPAARITNAATRFLKRDHEALAAHDWARYASLYPAGFQNIDRRTMVQLELDRDHYLEKFRPLFEMMSQLTGTLLATRGNRLVMCRVSWEGGDATVGPSQIDFLMVMEVDDHGDPVALVQFDPNDLDAAYAELDARYAAGEAAPYPAALEFGQRIRRGNATGDLEALAALCAPDFVVEDHTPLGWGTLDRSAYIESVKALYALAPDSRVRTDHLWVCDRGALGVHVVLGTHEGGAFEQPRVTVSELDAQGRERRRDIYTPDQLDEARARFAELVLSPSKALPARVENAATRAVDRLHGAGTARDWKRFAALFPPQFRLIERRRMVQLEIDRDQYLDSFRPFFEMTSSNPPDEVLATRGSRLALFRCLWVGANGESGPSELEWLTIMEVDDRGAPTAAVTFDPEDLDAAYVELGRLYAAGEAASYARAAEILRRVERAGAARDWEDLASVFSPDLVFEDHRLIGWGTLHSRDEYVARIRALVDLAPDVTTRADHVLALDDHGVLSVGRWVGSHEGGPFEIPFVAVAVLGPEGHIQRIDTYDLEQLDTARARFDELRSANSKLEIRNSKQIRNSKPQ